MSKTKISKDRLPEDDIMAKEFIQTQIKESEKRVEKLNKEFKIIMKHIDRLFKELNRVV